MPTIAHNGATQTNPKCLVDWTYRGYPIELGGSNLGKYILVRFVVKTAKYRSHSESRNGFQNALEAACAFIDDRIELEEARKHFEDLKLETFLGAA
jgi:hypothetical protein